MYRLTKYIQLDISQSGTIPAARLVDPSNVNQGSIIYSGFNNLGGGQFLWDYSSFPDNFRGAVKIYPSGTPSGTPLGGFSINPQEAEWLDTRISDLTVSNHGDFQLEVDVIDQFSDPVGSANIGIYPSGGGNLISILTSNSATGKAYFNLDAASYEIRSSKANYATFLPYYINLSSNSTIEVQGNKFVVDTGIIGETMRLYFYANTLGLQPQANIRLTVSPSGATDYNEIAIILKQPVTALSDSDGYCFLDIPNDPNIKLRARIPECGFDVFFQVPSSGTTFNLATLAD